MIEDEFAARLADVGQRVDLDFDFDSDTLFIYNFSVPESDRNQNVGTDVMSELLSLAEAYNRSTVEAHIDLTHRGTDGYPSEKNIHDDPTLSFLRSLDFSIVDYGPNRTVLAKKSIQWV